MSRLLEVEHGFFFARERFKVCDKIFDGIVNRGIFYEREENFGRNCRRTYSALAKLQNLLRIFETSRNDFRFHFVGGKNLLNLLRDGYSVEAHVGDSVDVRGGVTGTALPAMNACMGV